MNKIFPRAHSGNAIVEMLLFTPLALLFLFVVIDAGMLALEKAAISDALRGGMNSKLFFERNGSVLQLSDDLSLQLTSGYSQNQVSGEIPQLLSEVSSQIVTEVAKIQGYGPDEVPSTFKVTLAAVLLHIDATSGKVLSSEVLRPIVNVPQGFELSQYNPNFAYRSMDEYLSEQLRSSSVADREASPFAIPAGVTYQPTALTTGEARYLENAVLLYGEVTATSRGINRSYVKSALGDFYVLQDQHIIPLKSPFS